MEKDDMSLMDKELIQEKFRGVYARLDANNQLLHQELKFITELLQKTHDQTSQTNGRVTRLENSHDRRDEYIDEMRDYNANLNNKIETLRIKMSLLNDQTRVSRWFQEKPQRYLLFLIPFMVSIKEFRDVLIDIIKFW